MVDDPVVPAHAILGDERRDGGGREGLADRAGGENGIRVDPVAAALDPEPVALDHRHLAVADDGDR